MKYANPVSLLLLLSRVRISDDIIKNVCLIIKEGIDWSCFYNTAMNHGVAPLIYKHLSLFDNIPDEVIDKFKNTYLHNIRDTVLTSHELGILLNLMNNESLEAIPIKGLTTTEELYGNIALYPSVDMDIMVRRKDIYKIKKIMETMGYQTVDEFNEFYLRNYSTVHFSRKGKKYIEFHITLGHPRYFDIPEDFWWEDLRKSTLNDYNYRLLALEKNLLFLCLHLSAHGYSTLKFLVTIAEMLRIHKDGFVWEKLLGYSRRINAYHTLLLSLHLTSSLLDAPLPNEIHNCFKELSWKERWIYKKIEKNVLNENASYSMIMFLNLILRYNFFKMIQQITKWLFPPLKEVSYRYNLPLNSKKVYLYYIMNPFLLLSKKRNI
jgi:hypothetical protein